MLARHLIFESLWWAIACAIAAIGLLPPYLAVGPFAYLLDLCLVIIGLVTLGRMLFFTQQTVWLKSKAVKGIFCIVCVPIFWLAVSTVNNVQTLVDAVGYQGIFFDSQGPQATTWGTYLSSVAVFAGTGLAISCVILPIAFIIRIWQQMKSTVRTS